MEMNQKEDRSSTKTIWLRGLFMLLFMIAFGVGEVVLTLIAIVQFLWLLIKREPNSFLVDFAASLSRWFSETILFICCASDEKPFPWKEWPRSN